MNIKIIFILLAVTFVSSNAFCADTFKEPLDFRGIRFDSYYSVIKNIKHYSKVNEVIDIYVKDDEDLIIEHEPLDKILYQTFRGRIYKITVKGSKCSWNRLYTLLKGKYGACQMHDEDFDNYSCIWNGKRIRIELTIDYETNFGSLVYTYNFTEKEYKRYEENKNKKKNDSF
mgnify:FL=1